MSSDESFSSISSDSSTESINDSDTETYEIEPRHTRPTVSQIQTDLNADDTDVEDDAQIVVKKGRGKNKVYDLVAEQISLNDAIEFIKGFESVKWTRADTRNTEEGEKRFYTCIKGCPKRLYILLNAEDEFVNIYASDDNHQHDNPTRSNRNTTLPRVTREKVIQLLELGVNKNRQILKEIERSNLTMITKMQLRNIKAYWKKKKFGPAQADLRELVDWCNERKEIPEDLDKVFVGGISYKISTKNKIKKLNIFLTTKRLLQFTKFNSLVATDSTYKLNWQGYPLMLVGTVDQQRHFHPFGVLLRRNEKSEDFQFMFNCLSSLSSNINLINYEPKYLLADSAHSITNGFELHFKYKPTRIVCWAHAFCKFRKKYAPLIKNKETRGQVTKDLKKLQMAHSPEIFFKAKDLLLSKWTGEANMALNKFYEFWLLEENCGWFEGKAPGFPSTNNGLESTNRYIKEDGTLRLRLAIKQFLNLIENGFLRTWSTDRNPVNNVNLVEYKTAPEIDFETIKNAYHWSLKSRPVISTKIDGKRYFFVQSSTYRGPNLDSTICKNFFKTIKCLSWNSFDEYYSDFNSIYFIDYDKDNWGKSRCSCPHWSKNFMCKHVVGLTERLNKYEFPSNVKAIPLGQKRKPGRPKTTVECLEFQPGEQVSDSSDEDTFEELLDIPINDQKKTYKNNSSNILFDNDEPGPSQPIKPKRGRGRPSKNSQITITSAKKRDAKNTSDAAVSQTQNKKRRI